MLTARVWLAGGVSLLAGMTMAAGSAPGSTGPAPPEISVSSAQSAPGGQVTVVLDGETGSATIGAFAIDLFFDPAVVSAVECTSTVGICNEAYDASRARVAGAFLGGVAGHIEFAQITFDVIGGPGSQSVLEVGIVQLSGTGSEDYAGEAVVHNGQISVITAVLKGDADCDGEIDSADALAILREVAGLSSAACGGAADIDCDGDLTATDALGVLRYVVSLPVVAPDGCAPIGRSP